MPQDANSDNLIQNLGFDRGKPFYPLIMNYSIQIAGLRELMIRGILSYRKVTKENLESIISKDRLQTNTDQEVIEEFCNKPLELLCESHSRRIEIDSDEIAQELLREHVYVFEHYCRSAFNVLIVAYEITKAHNFKGHLWEFLKHCRNAAAHNGSFCFRNNEPKDDAVWKSFRIAKGDTTLQDTPLFKGYDKQGLLSLGDPIRLLFDIEQEYPQITRIGNRTKLV